MQPPTEVHPTLWRTCRAIANRSRLRLFGLLVQQSGQTVGGLAERAKLPPALTSQYLRALEARGLLVVQRTGRWVRYRPCDAKNTNTTALVAAMIETFRNESHPVETIFKLATAFTHPRRVELFKLIHTQSRPAEQLRTAAQMSFWASARHLRKLENRGFVARQGRTYAVIKPTNDFQRELVRLATG